MTTTALVDVLGAVAYGEQKAHEKAAERARLADSDVERRQWRRIAAEELRHHKGFVRRLEALGAEPQQAMAPFRAALDRFHDRPAGTGPEAAVVDLLGEGVATDLLTWLRTVADEETAAFIDTVLADEASHEARAAAEVRRHVGSHPLAAWRGALAALTMVGRMAAAGGDDTGAFVAFLRAGRGPALLAGLVAGYLRRLHAMGIGPLAGVERLDPTGLVAGLDPWRPREAPSPLRPGVARPG